MCGQKTPHKSRVGGANCECSIRWTHAVDDVSPVHSKRNRVACKSETDPTRLDQGVIGVRRGKTPRVYGASWPNPKLSDGGDFEYTTSVASLRLYQNITKTRLNPVRLRRAEPAEDARETIFLCQDQLLSPRGGLVPLAEECAYCRLLLNRRQHDWNALERRLVQLVAPSTLTSQERFEAPMAEVIVEPLSRATLTRLDDMRVIVDVELPANKNRLRFLVNFEKVVAIFPD